MNFFSFYLFLLNKKKKRYAYFSYAFTGHFAHAGQCLVVVLFCLLYIWHYWRATLAGNFTAKMCFRCARKYTRSAIKVSYFVQKKKKNLLNCYSFNNKEIIIILNLNSNSNRNQIKPNKKIITIITMCSRVNMSTNPNITTYGTITCLKPLFKYNSIFNFRITSTVKKKN